MPPLRIEVWSDIVCPWCYIGKHRLEAALRQLPEREAVIVDWRSFQLDPSAPPERDLGISYLERLASKYGTSRRQAQVMIDRVTGIARAEGLDFELERARTGNTFDAHRVLQAARRRDPALAVTLAERMFRAHFSEGQALAEHDTLVRLASEVGLDADQVAAVLASDAHGDDVRADQEEAAELGIDGVPFFVVDSRFGVAGAQPPELLLDVFSRARHEAEPQAASAEARR